MWLLPAFLALIPPLAPALQAQDTAAEGAPAPAGGTDDSLQAFLRRIRAERAAEFARLRGRVEGLIGRFSIVRSAQETQKIHAEIDSLGPEAAPLILGHLDPGEKPTPERERQCQEIAASLARSKNPAIQDELVRLARSASPRGRVLALRILGEAPEPDRARTALQELFPELRGALRAECVRSLARLDPVEPPVDPVVEQALADPEPEVVSAALDALAALPRQKPHPGVVALARDPGRAAPVLEALVRYCRGGGLDEDTAAAVLGLASRDDLAVDSRLRLLAGLPDFGVGLSPKLRRELDPLLESSDSALREGALMALARMKDSRAKRELLRYYDDLVQNNAGWAQAHQKRGDVLLRIGEFKDAVRDFRTAIELLEEDARLPANRELWVSLARAYVKDDKLRLAAEALEEFRLTADMKRELSRDPDFAPLLDSRYKKVFE